MPKIHQYKPMLPPFKCFRQSFYEEGTTIGEGLLMFRKNVLTAERTGSRWDVNFGRESRWTQSFFASASQRNKCQQQLFQFIPIGRECRIKKEGVAINARKPNIPVATLSGFKMYPVSFVSATDARRGRLTIRAHNVRTCRQQQMWHEQTCIGLF